MSKAGDYLPEGSAAFVGDRALLAAAGEELTDPQITRIKTTAREHARSVTPVEAFFYAAWLVYYAEGGE